MSDNSTRWQRVVSQPGDKPRFQARQTTGDIPPPAGRRRRRSTDTPAEARDRTQRWWILGVLGLSALAGILSWLVFFG